jgi:hypothetical protein
MTFVHDAYYRYDDADNIVIFGVPRKKNLVEWMGVSGAHCWDGPVAGDGLLAMLTTIGS